MLYRTFKDLSLSALGFGAMRLPVLENDDSRIDETETQRMVDRAMEAGINYYDTAWGYHGGHSEPVIGKCLSRHPRETYYLASKFPGYDLSNMPKVKEIFEEQLRRTGVSYFDFYLFHNVCEMNIDAYLDPQYGIYEYLMEQKRNGRIRHLGFSCHGETDVLERFLNAYGNDMEFGQLQVNYLDWTFQHGKEKLELLKKWNIPLWVMEPLRGGKLAAPGKLFEDQLKRMRPDEEIPAWAFRFLLGIPETTMILSGMSTMEQLEKNLQTFSEEKLLSEAETQALLALAERSTSSNIVPCTACHYCVSHCPMELDIPHLLSLYNEHSFTGGGFIAPMALQAVPDDKKPQACIGCRSCEAVCPQQIPIADTLADFAEKLG